MATSRKPRAPSSSAIEVIGARTHNLKNVTFRVERGSLTVVTGVSGSGKSSLAFDTLYAEGQRRYVESMSTYARQFLEKMQRPDVDAIRNVPPAIALEQKNAVTNARSTIGTATEVNDFLRLLFARVGRVVCPDCEVEVRGDTPQSAAETLARLADDGKPPRLVVIAPVRLTLAPSARAGIEESGGVASEARDGEETTPDLLQATLDEMRRQGFARALTESGETVDLEAFRPEHLTPLTEEEDDEPQLARLRSRTHGRKRPAAQGSPHRFRLDLVADRVALRPRARTRLTEALELAFRAAEGRARVRDAESGAEWAFSSELACNHCGRRFRKPEPALFSFSSPLGACPECEGFGRIIGIDFDKVIPNRKLTLAEKPVAPWNTPANRGMYGYMKRSAPHLPLDVPIEELGPEHYHDLVEGSPNPEGEDWCGIRGFFDWLEGRRYKIQTRVMLARYRAYSTCPACNGTRLRPEALDVRVDGRNIAEVCRRSIEDLHEYFDLLRLSESESPRAARILEEIRSRLHYLDSVGLGYLTLDRQTRTLSGGEAQRINLATALGSALTETLYVLDEPTVGLHSRDTFRLLKILQALRERGNTVVVVEHDPDIVLGADYAIDIGPGAGEHGGEILYAGALRGLARAENSATARYLAADGKLPLPSRGRKPSGWVTVRGARENNLRDIDVRFPRGVLCCVTGVSGSGKTTLVQSILYAGFHRQLLERRKETKARKTATGERADLDVGDFDALEGAAALEDMALVDQKPIGRSSRSNPVTYVKAYDEIRKLFSATREARRAGIKPGHFSFNVPGGRCETCQGAGVVSIDMHFLADVEVTCDECDGKRFQRRILEIEWNGKNVDDVLDMTVEEAFGFFAENTRIRNALEPLVDAGLGYIRLGQSTATLSGGEAQRLKLAGFLAQNRSARRASHEGDGGVGSSAASRGKASDSLSRIFMIFDEPTTGLHPEDLARLMRLMQRLVDHGVTVLVVEHNLDLIAHADWVIDLGPEGGEGGGRVVAEGPPPTIMAAPDSHTGRFLAQRFRAP